MWIYIFPVFKKGIKILILEAILHWICSFNYVVSLLIIDMEKGKEGMLINFIVDKWSEEYLT